jgi:anti-sigma regulatory factor (Ser/Thr protein kinase)
LYGRAIEHTLSLPADPSSVSKARRFVRAALDGAGGAEFDEGAVLLVSELVTNALLHARTGPEVILRLDGDSLWIGVRDGSPVVPAPKRYRVDAATGRGLQLVERIAARWGVDSDGSGKVVWFELDQSSAARFAQAQEEVLLEELGQIQADLDGTGGPILGRSDRGRAPGATARNGVLVRAGSPVSA